MSKNEVLLCLVTERASSSFGSSGTGCDLCSVVLGGSFRFVKGFAISCSEVLFDLSDAEDAVTVAGGACFLFFVILDASV